MDPITQAFAAVTAVLTTAEQIGLLISRLYDQQRTLDQAEADRRAASRMLDEGAPAVPAATGE
jgi:hypothetical protein